MRNMVAFISVLSGLLCFSSCHKDSNTNVDFKYEYFPVDTGHYVIYDVDSITFDNFFSPPKVDTVHFQLMELVQSVFNDNSGRPTDRIERYRRSDSTMNWGTVWQVWTATRTASTAERYEDNLRFIKLVFPPNLVTTWAGNTYIDLSDPSSSIAWLANWNYQVTALDVPNNINGLNFDSTLTVLDDSNQNVIQYTYEKEIYAKHVGLVSKQQWNLSKNAVDSFPAGSSSGFIYTMKVHSYHQ